MAVCIFGANFLLTTLRFAFAMSESTPPPDLVTGQLNHETLDEVAPRLRRFTQELVERLRACKLEVGTTSVYLLNSTDHPIEVPCSAGEVEIQMNFDASLPAWAPDPRARLQLSFNHGRRYNYWEVGSKRAFPMNKILTRCLREIQICSRTARIQTEKLRKHKNARDALESFRVDLGLPETNDPDTLRDANLKLRCLPKTPTQVIVMLTVSYEEATEIVRKYRKE